MLLSSAWSLPVPFAGAAAQRIVRESGDERRAPPPHGLHALLHSVLEHVLPLLGLREVEALAGASPPLLVACADDSLFQGLCLSAWGVAGSAALRTYNVACFRALYAVLNAFGPLQGVYTSLNDYPYGNVLKARFDNGEFVADNLVPDEGGGCARLFAVRFSQAAAPERITATTYCFHHHQPGSCVGHVAGKAARLRLVSQPQNPIAPSGVFAGRVACCSQLVVSPEHAVLEVLFNKSCPESDLAGTWFMEEEDEAAEEEGAASATGRPCKKLAELLAIGLGVQDDEEALSAVVSIAKLPPLFVCNQSRACLRAAGMEHWRRLPRPGLYRADYGAQYGHRRHEVCTMCVCVCVWAALLFESVRACVCVCVCVWCVCMCVGATH